MRQLMPQQKLALQYATKRARIALFMAMRLGKSLVAIRWTEAASLKRIFLSTTFVGDPKVRWVPKNENEMTMTTAMIIKKKR